jgi:hypothetical protein
MDETSAFMDKDRQPDDKALAATLEKTFTLWKQISDYVLSCYPKAQKEWNYPGAKYGWSFRIKDKKRAIIYLLPREKYFKAAFVFGQKATEVILDSDISPEIISELTTAKVYGEGRGIRIDVKGKKDLDAILFLIDTKIAN